MSAPFSVGIPLYNEEGILAGSVARLIAALEPLGRRFEILLGSNGSTDGTLEIARRLAARDARVRCFALPERGVGRVFDRFLDEAESDFLLSLDIDLSVDLAFVPRALALLEDHDLVVGSKRSGTQRRSLLRRGGSALFVSCARRLLGLPFEDYSMAAKAYRISRLRAAAREPVAGTAYVLYAVAAVRDAGGRLVEIAVDCEDRRRSRFNLPAEAAHKFWHLGRLWWKRRRNTTAAGPASPAPPSR